MFDGFIESYLKYQKEILEIKNFFKELFCEDNIQTLMIILSII